MRHQLRSHGALEGERSKPARLAVHATTDALLAGKVQRKVSNGIAGLPAAGKSSSDRKRSRPIRAFSATPHDGQRPCRTLAEDRGRTQPLSCVSPALQLKREWSPWPEFGWITGICATFQRDNLRRHF